MVATVMRQVVIVMSEPLRLDKHLVELIGCSRGEDQKYIEGGWVIPIHFHAGA